MPFVRLFLYIRAAVMFLGRRLKKSAEEWILFLRGQRREEGWQEEKSGGEIFSTRT